MAEQKPTTSDQVNEMKASSQALGFACNSMYQTQHQQYGQHYMVEDQKVPTYGEYVDSLQDFKKMEKLLKNKKVAQKYSQENANIEQMSEIEREKYKFDRNVVVPKNFPHKADDFKYPEHGLNTGNVLYRTSNRDYGSKLPSEIEVPTRYYPRDCNYTKQFPGNYAFNGLNTNVTFSKVHQQLNEF